MLKQRNTFSVYQKIKYFFNLRRKLFKLSSFILENNENVEI